MKKSMKIMLFCLAIFFGGLFLYKLIMSFMIKKFLANMKDIPTVSTVQVKLQPWQNDLQVVGSLRAVEGTIISNELPGTVEKVFFTAGSVVKQGALLLQLDVASDEAQWHSLQANAELAKSVYHRDKAQYAIGAISKANLEADAADVKSKQALADQQKALIAKKVIHAPFSGRIGISQINVGQYLSAGTKIASLQTFNPIDVDFYVPQQQLFSLKIGQKVNVENNVFPKKIFTGSITAIDSVIDENTRNVEVEATIPNPKEELVPGMFAKVTVNLGDSENYLVVPQTAITYDSYGSSVYIVKKSLDTKDGKSVPKVEQSFVVTGAIKGNEVVILKGLKEGDEIVSGGQMKLKNHMQVNINNNPITPSKELS